MHDIQTPAQLANAVFVKSLLMEREAEGRAMEEVMALFKRDRGVEMLRLSEDVIKPHMREWAHSWFAEHGLNVSLLPDLLPVDPAALLG